MPKVCQMVGQQAYNMGIQVVKELDPVWYGKFLKERAEFLEQKRKELDEAKETKVLKTK